MRKVLNFVKGKKDDKKDGNLSLNITNISVEITDPKGITTPSDDYDFIGTTQQCTDYEVDLTGKDKTITKLHKAAWFGNLDKAKTHLKKIDVNAVDASNRAPLHLAAAQGHTNVVWFLLSNKARMDIYDLGKKTAFMKAVEGGYKEIVSNMLEKGADINVQDSEGNTALHIATKLGYYDIASVLLKKGANFESVNKKGEYPLHIATTAEHMDLVELLLRYGASVNVTDSDSRTPLMLAARFGNTLLVELFLEYKARRDMVDCNSLTAQDHAINQGYGDLAALLVTEISTIPSEDKIGDETSGTSPQSLLKEESGPSKSLVPASGSHQGIADETGEDADSWNDSHISDSNSKAKIPNSKLRKFLSPSSDEDGSEDQSPTKEEKNVHDSPHSCVIPPPLKPPRSWDLIQAGMIDDNTGSEVKRCSLTALGTLRSRRESFNDSNKSDGESPISVKDPTELRFLEKTNISLTKPSSSNKEAPASSQKKDKSDLSIVESDWDSDESLPLDNSASREQSKHDGLSPKQSHCVSVDVHHEPVEEEALPEPPYQLIAPDDSSLLQVSAPESGAVSPEPVSEKRARMLLMQNQQSVELTLTDDHTEEKSDHSEGSPSALPRDIEGESNIQVPLIVGGTLGRDGTMLGYEEMWESNAAFDPSSPSSTNQESGHSTSHSLPRIEEKVETSEGEQSPSSQIIIDLNLPKVTEIPVVMNLIKSPIVCTIDSISPPGRVPVGDNWEEGTDLTKTLQESKTPGTKRHVRNKSIFLPQPAADSEQKQEMNHAVEASLPENIQAFQNQWIDRQLECYDEAIRDLALSKSCESASLQTNMSLDAKISLQADDSGNNLSENCHIMPDLLSGSKVAALTAVFGSAKSGCESLGKPSNSLSKKELAMKNQEEKETESGRVEPTTSIRQNSAEQPIRKKRKSLFALQKLDPSKSQGQPNADVDLSSSDSDDEPAHWGPMVSSKVHRQSTVIKKDEDGLIILPPSLLSPGSPSLSEDVQIDHLCSGSSNEDATVPLEETLGIANTAAGFQSADERSDILIADSDLESGTSQPDGSPSHSYSKSQESILKHHLQAVTEERGRLAETTVELGERTERLLYELADAREAARARDEVISLLQMQLLRLEESHTRGLEEVQTHRFHLDSRDQELRHLEELCCKSEEEKQNLKEIIRLKDKEILSLSQTQATREEEVQVQLMGREKEKDLTISELKIHQKYLEEENQKLKETLNTLQQQQVTIQARNEALLEEKARATVQHASDLRSAQEETNKWRNLYESSLVKLEAMDKTRVNVLLDAKNRKEETAQSYHSEILSAVERLEKEKEADRQIWQAKIKEEVGNAVHLLKSEYEKVEQALRNHNETLEVMAEKLQKDLQVACKRQEFLELQLKMSQEEMQLAKKEVSGMHNLQLELSHVRHQALTDSNTIKTLASECEAKDQALRDVRKTLEIMRLEKVYCQREAQKSYMEPSSFNEGFSSLLGSLRARNDFLHGELCEKKVETLAGSTVTDNSEEMVNALLKEKEELRHHILKLNEQLKQIGDELKLSSKELCAERLKVSTLSAELKDARKGITNKATSQIENALLQEKEELEKQIMELKSRLQKRDSSPSSASLSNASAMTDQVRWNQSGLMGVVQRQKEEIETLKAECLKLKVKSPQGIPPEIKQRSFKQPDRKHSNNSKKSQNAVDLLQTIKTEVADSPASVSDKINLKRSVCEKCGESPLPSKKTCVETQTLQGCESPAHASKCSSPRHNWSKNTGLNLEHELQAQAERCLKHQQMIAGLKSELQLLRGGNSDYQINLQRQVSDLQRKVKDEVMLRSSLEMQLTKMKYAVQERGQMERELEKLQARLEREFVSRRELDHLKFRHRFDSENTLHSELSSKLAQVNKQDGSITETSETQIRKEYEETRKYLESELAKVQESLKAKEDEENELKLKFEMLSREHDKKNEQRRKMLIEKSHILGEQSKKDNHPASYGFNLPSAFPKSTPSESTSSVVSENPYSQLLQKEVKKSAEKFKTAEPIPDISSAGKTEEYLKRKYCLP